MSTGDTRLEIGHVLFIDVVGYSKLLVTQRSELLSELNEVVGGTHHFRARLNNQLQRSVVSPSTPLVFPAARPMLDKL
jgi:hypothetical protein